MTELKTDERRPSILSDEMVRTMLAVVRHVGWYKPRTTAVVVNKRRELLLVWSERHNTHVLPSFLMSGTNPLIEAIGGLSREHRVQPDYTRVAGGTYPLFTEEVDPTPGRNSGEFHLGVGFEYYLPGPEIPEAEPTYRWFPANMLLQEAKEGSIRYVLRLAAEWALAFEWSDQSVAAQLERRKKRRAPGRKHYQRQPRRAHARAA